MKSMIALTGLMMMMMMTGGAQADPDFLRAERDLQSTNCGDDISVVADFVKCLDSKKGQINNDTALAPEVRACFALGDTLRISFQCSAKCKALQDSFFQSCQAVQPQIDACSAQKLGTCDTLRSSAELTTRMMANFIGVFVVIVAAALYQ